MTVTVINGGTQGLGEAVARELAARNATGLVISGRSKGRGEVLAAELSSSGTPTFFVHADLSDPSSSEKVVEVADKSFGIVHGLVNVAAITDRANVWELNADHIDQVFALNLRAPLLSVQCAAKIMRRENVAGSIVNIGSTSCYGGQPFLIAYSASKAALATATRSLAYSLMRYKIRVNQINPGWMDTDSEDATQRRWHGATDGWLEEAEAIQPLGRLIKPQEVAKVVAFYLSDESGIMTGNVTDYDQSVLGAGDPAKPTLNETPL